MNFSLSEILLILVIALIVIKPEQLPSTAKSLGRLFKTFQSLFAKLKAEMNALIDTVDKPEHKRK